MTKTQWAGCSEKAQWDIKVAIRGPDSYYGETLKWFTASVIRGQMRDVFRVGGLVNSDLNLVILPTGKWDGHKKSEWNYEHFVEHIHTAARHLGVPTLWIEASVWHEAMQGSNVKEAGSAILAAAAAWGEKLAAATNEWDECRPNRLYTVALINELDRHLKEGVRW